MSDETGPDGPTAPPATPATPSSAGGLELPASTVPDPASAPALRWGVVSPGHIAGQFTDTLHAATASRVVAVVSRSLERAEDFAAAHAPTDGPAPRAFADVAAMLEAGGVDAVYIASPHAQHHALARPVLEAGVPVLVEKAFTLNRPEAVDLLDLARERGVFCMEAMWARFLPQHDVLRSVLAAGTLGDVVTVRADHGQAFAPDPSHRLYDPELGGGALLDLGVYPVSFAQMVLGDLGDLAVRGSLTDTGVDAELALLATGSHGGTAVLDTTLRSRTANEAWVHGTRGSAHLSSAFYAPGTLTVTTDDGGRATFTHPGDRDLGMAYEAAEAARRIVAGETSSPVMSWEDTLSVMGTMDAVRAALGVVYPGESGR